MDIHSQTVQLIDSGEPFCVVVVLSAEGSTPRKAGVRALVDAEGRIYGTVGGGQVEAEAQRAAMEACRAGAAALLEIALAGEAAADRDPVCGGHMRLLVDPTAQKDAPAYRAAAAALAERRRGVLVTRVLAGDPVTTEVTWHPEHELASADEAGVDADTLHACLTDGCSRLVDLSAAEQRGWALVEPLIPGPRLLIAGGGHVGQALAAQAVLVGFDVTVIDDRPEFAEPERFAPGVSTQCCDIAACLAEAETDGDTYIVIVTRGHRHDAEALRACLRKPVAYLGMIGSQRKVALIREDLLASGVATAAEVDAVYAPIGLDIGAETVPEIATSILAEMIAVRRKGSVDRCPKAMRDR